MTSASRTVLVVDDDADVRDYAILVLEEAGFGVVGAADSAAALTRLEAHPEIALLFTDVVMPGIDGIVLADMVKTRRPDLRVVYATAYNDIVRSRPGVIHGVILSKPYRPAQLVAAVAAAFDR